MATRKSNQCWGFRKRCKESHRRFWWVELLTLDIREEEEEEEVEKSGGWTVAEFWRRDDGRLLPSFLSASGLLRKRGISSSFDIVQDMYGRCEVYESYEAINRTTIGAYCQQNNSSNHNTLLLSRKWKQASSKNNEWLSAEKCDQSICDCCLDICDIVRSIYLLFSFRHLSFLTS